jgi:6-phosphogluconolactonase
VFAYVGTYTDPDRDGRGRGLYAYRVDEATGALAHVQTLEGVPNPHFLAVHPSGRFLYSTNGGDASAVSSYAIDGATGRVSQLNRQRSPGPGPTHLAVDPSGKLVVAANYAGGSVAAYPVGEDGRLAEHSEFVVHEGQTGPNPKRQDKAHAHVAVFDPTGRFVLVCDLGLDRTFVYRVDAAAGKLSQVGSAPAHPGQGPRHLAFHPSGRYVYVVDELDSTVTAFAWDDGSLRELQVAPMLPEGFAGESIAAEVVASPDGRHVYASNRGHDSLALFAVDPATGRLTPAGHEPTRGKTPRHFDIAPGGRFLYALNQDSDSVVVFELEDGKPRATGHVTEVGSPACIVFR